MKFFFDIPVEDNCRGYLGKFFTENVLKKANLSNIDIYIYYCVWLLTTVLILIVNVLFIILYIFTDNTIPDALNLWFLERTYENFILVYQLILLILIMPTALIYGDVLFKIYLKDTKFDCFSHNRTLSCDNLQSCKTAYKQIRWGKLAYALLMLCSFAVPKFFMDTLGRYQLAYFFVLMIFFTLSYPLLNTYLFINLKTVQVVKQKIKLLKK